MWKRFDRELPDVEDILIAHPSWDTWDRVQYKDNTINYLTDNYRYESPTHWMPAPVFPYRSKFHKGQLVNYLGEVVIIEDIDFRDHGHNDVTVRGRDEILFMVEENFLEEM